MFVIGYFSVRRRMTLGGNCEVTGKVALFCKMPLCLDPSGHLFDPIAAHPCRSDVNTPAHLSSLLSSQLLPARKEITLPDAEALFAVSRALSPAAAGAAAAATATTHTHTHTCTSFLVAD